MHESVKVDGRVGHLDANLLHYTCDSLSEHLKTMDRYTTLAAEEIVARRQKVPTHRLVIDPAWTFVKGYFLHRGFQDGPRRPCHRLHVVALHVSQVRQGPQHGVLGGL